ncbi:MAG TPA: thioesterase family protein [Candidatus Angelobacter sp.]
MDRKIEDVRTKDLKTKIWGETRLRVRYAETDKMGVVYHANFVIWFEVGRVELLRQLGFQYSDMEKDDNCHIPVVDLRVRYKAPAQYDDEIVVRTQIKNVRSSLLHFSYEVFREADRTLLATGETMHIIVDNKLERTTLPEKYLQAFNGFKRT